MDQRSASKQGRILFVDDEPIVCRSFARNMRQQGFIVDTAINGKEALDFIERYPYSVVATDLMMPEVDGLALIEHVHQLQPEATCVLVTGVSADDLPASSIGSHAIFEVVHKPWDDNALRQTLEKALRTARRMSSRSSVPQTQDNKLRILLVEDNPTDAQLVGAFLDDSVPDKYELTHVKRISEAEDLLREHQFRAVLLDLSLPDAKDLDGVIYLQGLDQGVPIIVLSGNTDETVALEAVKIGAQDYLMKGEVDGRGIDRAISYAIERRHLQERLETLARFDQLTGLANRTSYREALVDAVLRAQRTKKKVAVLFIDLDGFKAVNDTHGHDIGDFLLREVARRLDSTIREIDFLARLGGDEFALIIESPNQEHDVALAARRLINSLETPIVKDSLVLEISSSIGIALYPDTATDADELLKCADSAMYKAKASGKATYRFFDSLAHDHTTRRIKLEDELRQAVDQKDFVLHFQPQFRLEERANVVGFEALLRWKKPNGSLILPGEFLPLLEESRLIVPVERWVLDHACAQVQQWRHDAGSELAVSVNLSVRQFEDSGLVHAVKNALVKSGLDPCGLNLEVTENVLMANPELSIPIMNQLKALGVRITVDNFGTGCFSFKNIAELPIDAFKLDRSFVSKVQVSERDAVVAKSIIGLAHNFGFDVVALGVESAEQEAFFFREGADFIQGFRYGRPMNVEAATEWLDNFSPFEIDGT